MSTNTKQLTMLEQFSANELIFIVAKQQENNIFNWPNLLSLFKRVGKI